MNKEATNPGTNIDLEYSNESRTSRKSRRSRSWDVQWRKLLGSASTSSSCASSVSSSSSSKLSRADSFSKLDNSSSTFDSEAHIVEKKKSSSSKSKENKTGSRPRRSRSSGGARPRGRSKAGRKSVTTKSGKKNTPNTDIVNQYRECFKNHDIDGCVALTTPSCNLRYTGADAKVTNLKPFVVMMRTFVEACPDLSFVTDDTVEIVPGIVVIENVIIRGTHTGEPFRFSTYPPLPPNNVECMNDAENWIFFVCKGKIANMHYHCFGKHHGPMGFYQQIKAGASE